MATRRVIDDELHAHFITFSVTKRRRLLDLDHPKRILLGVLGQQLVAQHAQCVGFVLMPDHVHAIFWFPEPGQLSKFMHGLKRKSSFAIRKWYRENAPRYANGFGEGDRFWQPKYYDFAIFEQAKLEEKLAYMHENPVRVGLAARAIDYPWSSARWYELGRSVGVPVGWVE